MIDWARLIDNILGGQPIPKGGYLKGYVGDPEIPVPTTAPVDDIPNPQVIPTYPTLSDDAIRDRVNPDSPNSPFSQFIGNRHAVRQLSRAAFEALSRPNRSCDRSFAILGPTSTGKTTLVRLFAETLGIPLVEINAHTLNTPNDILMNINEVSRIAGCELQRLSETVWKTHLPNSPTCDFLVPPMIVFIDEAHGLSDTIGRVLLRAIASQSRIFISDKDWTADCRHICWMFAAADRTNVLDAISSHVTTLQLTYYTTQATTTLLSLHHPDWNDSLCRLVVRFAGHVPREALSFARDMRVEKEIHPKSSWEQVAQQVANDRGIDTTTATLDGDRTVSATILSYVDDYDIDVLVLGTHGRTGLDRFLLGNVAEAVLRDAPVPVLTVHEKTDVDRSFERVLIPTDGSESAFAALDDAVTFAEATGARLHVVHATAESQIGENTVTYDISDPDVATGIEEIDDTIERMESTQLDEVDVTTPSGRPDQAILAVASEANADCIVMGTHGRTGVRRYLLGSTTERVVRFAGVPVLAIRAPRTEVATVEYLDYAAIEELDVSLDDSDLFEQAGAADLASEVHGTLDVGRNEYILDAAESAGHDWPFQCRSGGCANCVAILHQGNIEMDVNRRLTDEEVAEKGYRLTCVGSPASDSVSIVYNAKLLDDLQDRVV